MKVNSEHGNARSIDEIRKKWNNLKLMAKSKVYSSFREARKTGGGSNQAVMAESEEMMIVSAEKCLSNSDRVTEMLKDTIAFSRIPKYKFETTFIYFAFIKYLSNHHRLLKV